MTVRGAPLYYWDYLQLDQLLGCQRPSSARRGEPAHDELLFIIVPQAFELWFKQILFELDAVLEVMAAATVPEKEMGQVVARLGRITTIQRLLLDQIDVLETMTPLDFLDFRDELIPASGFQIDAHPDLDDQGRAEQLAAFGQTAANFAAVFDSDRYAELVTHGKRSLSHQAFLAALLINLYRDEPIFQLPFRLLTALVDIDEGFTAWRYRHALLAHRMIGGRIGTGGTAGHAYLEAAARKHRVFHDLFDLPSFFIPRSALPTLPPEIAEQTGFRYRGQR